MMKYLGNDQIIDDEERIWKIEKVGWMCVSDNGVGIWGLGVKCVRNIAVDYPTCTIDIDSLNEDIKYQGPDYVRQFKSWLVDEIHYKDKQINRFSTETFLTDIIFSQE